ncbi:hypothetical protein GTN66_02160 [bacterium]|nr:hypothetical protein [bacterium]NIN92019.1 hypothetical protein [bacterium]NIO18235.1 hypothetical protein [bacterium]NIO73209.1 hypothetical protein [bacterium]
MRSCKPFFMVCPFISARDKSPKGEGSRIGLEQTELELRLQSKEEENNLLKKQITELEEQVRVEREKKVQEIQELRKTLEEIPRGQESI